MKDFEKICEERGVLKGLNEWDSAVEEARRRRDRAVEGQEPPRALHTLSGDELYTAHLTPFLVQAERDLSSRLEETQKDNLEMTERIKNQRTEIERLLGDLETLVADVEGGASVLEKQVTGDQDLRHEIWEMEREVAAAKS